jgi:thymidylate synthase (FAD)
LGGHLGSRHFDEESLLSESDSYPSQKLNQMDILKRVNGLRRPVTPHGFVELVDCMPRLASEAEFEHGLDVRIAEVARTSNGHGTNVNETGKTEALIRYLIRHNHSSPFEFMVLDFLVRAPMFVKTHFFRHRTASVNEESRRYKPISEEEEFYHPSWDYVEGVRRQAKTNRQSSVVDEAFSAAHAKCIEDLEQKVEDVIISTAALIDLGVANEVARFAIPVSTYTTFRFKIDLRNLLHLLKLRTAPDAQRETQWFANAMLDLVEPLFPMTFKVWREFAVDSVVLSSKEIEAIRTKSEFQSGSEGEKKEFANKLKRLGLIRDGE